MCNKGWFIFFPPLAVKFTERFAINALGGGRIRRMLYSIEHKHTTEIRELVGEER